MHCSWRLHVLIKRAVENIPLQPLYIYTCAVHRAIFCLLLQVSLLQVYLKLLVIYYHHKHIQVVDSKSEIRKNGLKFTY